MASLIASVLISLLPEVTLVAEGVGAEVAAATASEALGAAASSSVKGAVIGGVEKSVVALTDALFGDGIYEYLSKLENKLLSAGSATLEQLNRQSRLDLSNTDAFVEKLAGLFGQQDPRDVELEKEKLTRDLLLKSSKDLATFTNEFANELSVNTNYNVMNGQMPNTNDIERAFKQVFFNNPHMQFLILPILRRTVNLSPPNTQEFLDVEKVYNGRNIDPLKCFETQEAYNCPDELGQIISWRKTWSPKNPVPTIFGTYTGIHSKNNSLPQPIDANEEGLVIRRSLLDTFAMFHDTDYHVDGSFNKLADFKLISRCKNNQERFTFPGEYDAAVIAVNYFSTVGSLVRKLFGRDSLDAKVRADLQTIANLPDDPTTGQDFLRPTPEQLRTGTSTSTSTSTSIIDHINPNDPIIKQTKELVETEFITDFEKQFDQISRTSSVVTQPTTGQGYYERIKILNAFDDLPLVINF